MFSWITQHRQQLEALAGLSLAISLVSLLLTVALLPMMVLGLPVDYFVTEERDPLYRRRLHPALAAVAVVLKNLLGVALIVAGLVMVFIPGQGLLTMLVGLILTNFPGKFRLEQKLVRRPAVLRTLNRLRLRAGRAPLLAPGDFPPPVEPEEPPPR